MNYPAGSRGSHPQRVAAVIAAHNVGRAVAATVRACRAIPSVDLLIVVDDGSTDD
ncbi:MAG: glycosyltransferase, partial [Schaalia sp.]